MMTTTEKRELVGSLCRLGSRDDMIKELSKYPSHPDDLGSFVRSVRRMVNYCTTDQMDGEDIAITAPLRERIKNIGEWIG